MRPRHNDSNFWRLARRQRVLTQGKRRNPFQRIQGVLQLRPGFRTKLPYFIQLHPTSSSSSSSHQSNAGSRGEALRRYWTSAAVAYPCGPDIISNFWRLARRQRVFTEGKRRNPFQRIQGVLQLRPGFRTKLPYFIQLHPTSSSSSSSHQSNAGSRGEALRRYWTSAAVAYPCGPDIMTRTSGALLAGSEF